MENRASQRPQATSTAKDGDELPATPHACSLAPFPTANWNRSRNTRAAKNQKNIRSRATPTVAAVISTVQPLC